MQLNSSRVAPERRRRLCGAILLAGLVSSSVCVAERKKAETARAESSAKDGDDDRGPEAGDTVVRARSEFSAYEDTDAVTVFTPSVAATVEDPTSGWSATGTYLVDVVSAASVDIVSTASGRWEEVRNAGTLSGTYKPGVVGASVVGAVSREPDYTSLTAGGTLTGEFAKKTFNPRLGYTFTHDTAGRSGTPFSVFSQELVRHTASAGVELVLSGSMTLSVGVDAIFEDGDQKKPYRYLPLFEAGLAGLLRAGSSPAAVRSLGPEFIPEATPLSRTRVAVGGRLAKRFSGSTLVVTHRFYDDDWGLFASTTDARLVTDLSRRVSGWAHVRGHIQNGVSFWKRAYTGTTVGSLTLAPPKYRTGDRELSPLLAGTVGVGLAWALGSEPSKDSWTLTTQADVLSTRFTDALYIKQRIGALVVLQLEAVF